LFIFEREMAMLCKKCKYDVQDSKFCEMCGTATSEKLSWWQLATQEDKDEADAWFNAGCAVIIILVGIIILAISGLYSLVGWVLGI
jgi:uncharacterized membrane protein YvbJ